MAYKPTLVNSRYGSPMGRTSYAPIELAGDSQHKLNLCKMPMDSDGCYDTGGAYWGIGETLWVAYSEDFELYTRARTREAAAKELAATYKGFQFKFRGIEL